MEDVCSSQAAGFMARSMSYFDDFKELPTGQGIKITKVDRIALVMLNRRYIVIGRYENAKQQYCIFNVEYFSVRNNGSFFILDNGGPYILSLDGSKIIGHADAIIRARNSTKTLKSAVEIFRQMFPKKKFYTFE